MRTQASPPCPRQPSSSTASGAIPTRHPFVFGRKIWWLEVFAVEGSEREGIYVYLVEAADVDARFWEGSAFGE